MRQPIDVEVKQMTRVGRADDLYELDNNHAKQLRVLVREVRSRILRLEKQRVALNQALAALRKVESQATAALARLANAERRAV